MSPDMAVITRQLSRTLMVLGWEMSRGNFLIKIPIGVNRRTLPESKTTRNSFQTLTSLGSSGKKPKCENKLLTQILPINFFPKEWQLPLSNSNRQIVLQPLSATKTTPFGEQQMLVMNAFSTSSSFTALTGVCVISVALE